MQFKLALLALVGSALAAPTLVERQYGSPSVTCGSNSYSSSQVDEAISNAMNGGGGDYPHQYNDYEGFDFSDYCSDSKFEEYPITRNGYTGGSPGADRVVYGQSSGSFCGAITHSGASGNDFVQCDY